MSDDLKARLIMAESEIKQMKTVIDTLNQQRKSFFNYKEYADLKIRVAEKILDQLGYKWEAVDKEYKRR